MTLCEKCKKEIPEDSTHCPYCGESQPFASSRNDISKKTLAQKEIAEDNTDHLEAAIQESEKSSKRKQSTVLLAIVAVAVVILSSIVTSTVIRIESEKAIRKENAEKTREMFESLESVDNSVNEKGYYHFENDFETTIKKHIEFVDSEFDNEITTSLEPSNTSDFSKEETVYLLGEKVTRYYFQYYGGKTAISFMVNDDNRISAFSFYFLSSVANDALSTTDTYKIEQLIYKPSRWLRAMQSYLSERNSIDIYEGLLTGITKTNATERCSYYYEGYTVLANNSGSTQVLTILKTEKDFAERNNISVNGESIYSSTNKEHETEVVQDTTKNDGRTYFADFSVILPDDWTYEDYDDRIEFNSKYSYENDIQENLYGRIFTIEKTKLTESDYMEAVKLLGTKDGYNYFVVYPMGMGVSKDEKANQTHSAALAEQDDVINSFKLISTSSTGSDTESSTKFSSDPTEIIEESPLYGKLRFTFTYKELYSRQQNALTKLGLKGSKQYDWDLDELLINDEHYKWSHEDLETMWYKFICKDDNYYWWEHIYCTKYEESDLVRGFEMCIKLRDGIEQTTAIRNFVKISLLTVNPDLTVEQAETAMNQLYNSPDSFNTDRCMYYNGVFYRLALGGNQSYIAVVVKPMTESDYQKSIDQKNTN